VIVKIAIVSDIHANFDAISAFPENYDELWVLGDLVNYGPEPAAVIDFVKSHAAVVVRGNHDHSVGFHEDPRCSPRFRALAEATGRVTDSILNFSEKHYLRSLPLQVETRRGETRFYLCHAIPSDPLFGYCEADSSRWFDEIEIASADIVLVGHTHVPAIRSFGRRRVVNPGSLGQPKTGNAQACYAIWQDGNIELKSFPYEVETAVAKVQTMPVSEGLRNELAMILRTGVIPDS
jgi:putative phosphoesterase